MNTGKYIATIAALLFVFSCKTYQQRVSNQNLAGLYKKEAGQIHPQLTLYHSAERTTDLYFKIPSTELLYSRLKEDSGFTARFEVYCKLTLSYESTAPVDTVTLRINDVNPSGAAKEISGKLSIKTPEAVLYVLEVRVTDLNKNNVSRFYFDVDKRNAYNSQNFLVKEAAADQPLFRNYTAAGEEFRVQYNSNLSGKLFVRYYKRAFPLALPPFSITGERPFNYAADSVFEIPLEAGSSGKIALKGKGFYHFQADSSKKEGLTIYRHYDGFPSIKTAEQLVHPMRYITSRQEYEEMETSKNMKSAVDNFWLKCAGSPERAKEIIRKFYNRVQDANQYFSSYLEGWKTDRGMVYIIYGPPNVIYRTSTSESWVYGEDNNMLSITYTFARYGNPFSGNDYQLERSGTFKESWYKAVDAWRQGRVYLEN